MHTRPFKHWLQPRAGAALLRRAGAALLRRNGATLLRRAGAALLAACLLVGAAGAPSYAAGPPGVGSAVYVAPATLYEEYRGADGQVRGALLRFDPSHPDLELTLTHANDHLYSRASLPVQAARFGQRVVAGVNGDYFYLVPEAPGAPLGLMIQDGRLLSSGRGIAVGVDADGEPVIGDVSMSTQLVIRDRETGEAIAQRSICAINKPRAADCLVLYTEAWGDTTRTNEWGYEVEVQPDDDELPRDGSVEAHVVDVFEEGDNPIRRGRWVLSGHGSAADFLRRLERGQFVSIRVTLNEPWASAVHAIGGGEKLVEGGQIVVPSNGSNQREPRTAVGIDKDGRWLWLVIDGRQPGWSRGVSFRELAEIMRAAGAVSAVSLDGGGSSIMLVRQPGRLDATVANRPSDGLRSIGNAWILLSHAEPGPVEYLWLETESTRVLPFAEVEVTALAQDASYSPVALASGALRWSASGSAAVEPLRDAPAVRWTPSTPGRRVTLTVEAENREAEIAVEVVGPDAIARVEVTPSPDGFEPGRSLRLRATAYADDGTALPAGAETFVWKGDGDFASITPDGDVTIPEGFARGTITLLLQYDDENGERKQAPVWQRSLTVGDPPPFADMEGHWAERFVARLNQQGIITGYPDGTFAPERPVTREEFAVMLMRLEALRSGRPLLEGSEASAGVDGEEKDEDQEPPAFSDWDDVQPWAQPALAAAVAAGYLSGYEDGTLRPQRLMSRQEVAAMLMRLPDLPAQRGTPEPFADDAAIAAWARASVMDAAARGILSGYPDGSFGPERQITRAEAATLFYNLQALGE